MNTTPGFNRLQYLLSFISSFFILFATFIFVRAWSDFLDLSLMEAKYWSLNIGIFVWMLSLVFFSYRRSQGLRSQNLGYILLAITLFTALSIVIGMTGYDPAAPKKEQVPTIVALSIFLVLFPVALIYLLAGTKDHVQMSPHTPAYRMPDNAFRHHLQQNQQVAQPASRQYVSRPGKSFQEIQAELGDLSKPQKQTDQNWPIIYLAIFLGNTLFNFQKFGLTLNLFYAMAIMGALLGVVYLISQLFQKPEV